MLDPTFNGENIIQTNNVNWPELDVPEINQAMNDAKLLTDPAERAEAWAEIDRMVSEQAPTVNWIWDKDVSIQSPNVQGVVVERTASGTGRTPRSSRTDRGPARPADRRGGRDPSFITEKPPWPPTSSAASPG